MQFFSYESKFSQILLKLCWSCYLNLLWFVCSLPIVTIGASTTALYYASLKLVREEDSSLTRQFFRSFRENFKQATVLWLILLGVSAAGPLAVMWTLILAVVIAASVVYVIVLLYVFPLLASVCNTNRAMLKNAFLIGTHYLFATILIFAVHFAMFFVVVAWFTPLIVFGEGLCALISAWLLNSILIASSGTPEDRKAEEPKEEKKLPKKEEKRYRKQGLTKDPTVIYGQNFSEEPIPMD